MSFHLKKTKQGIVINNKVDKTITVLVEKRKKHPLYRRTVVRSKKYLVHDANNICEIGDFVEIMESRPISRRKRFIFVEKVMESKK